MQVENKGIKLKDQGKTREAYSPMTAGTFSFSTAVTSEIRNNVLILHEDLGHHRYRKLVIDSETGELIIECHSANRVELFPGGCNAITRELMLSRDVLPNDTDRVYVCHPTSGFVYFDKVLSRDNNVFGAKKGTGNGRGRTRGKPKKLIIEEDMIDELKRKLDDTSFSFLFSLAKLARWDNGLIAYRGQALSKADMARRTNTPKSTLLKRLGQLVSSGVVEKKDNGYYLHRKYITKG